MKATDTDFDVLVNAAMARPDVVHLRPVIQKELLHYDILFYLNEAKLLNGLVFQGGTSLRLCYGSHRHSEDLYFVGGRGFSADMLTGAKECLEDYLGARYGLDVMVKKPASVKDDRNQAELTIDRWQVSVVTAHRRKDLPKRRIRIEVANIPAYTTDAVQIRKNYPLLPDGYSDMIIVVETLNEIMADKLVSLAVSQKYVRYRDIWDLYWLKQQGAMPDPDLIKCKIEDYHQPDYPKMLNSTVRRLPSILADIRFKDEMKRFLPTDVYDRTLGNEKFGQFMVRSITGLFAKIKQEL